MHDKLKPAKRLIVDLSSLCWTALYQGTDHEFGYEVEQVREDGSTKMVKVNSAAHGLENAIDFLSLAWERTGIQPKDTILVMESGNTKGLRQRLLPEYKVSRGTSPEELYKEFNSLKMQIIDAVKSVGGRSVTRANMEGDDVIAYLVKELEGEKVIMSQDGDLSVLLDIEGVSLFRKGQIETENPYGPFELRHIPVYKALVGDSSDNITGAKGFGPKAWLDFLGVFGDEGVDMMQDLIREGRLQELEANIDDFKPIKRIVDNAKQVEASFAAGLLYPELVENMRLPLIWDAGYVKAKADITDERLRKYGGSTRIVHADNFLDAIKFLKQQVKHSEYIALDLETDVPAESQEWLEENRRPKGVDVVASEVVSMGLTFGSNQHLNLYFVMNHNEEDGLRNITKEQFRAVLDVIAEDIPKIIHNVAFELPVLYRNFGKLTDQIFINPCFDTAIAANYVNENIGQGLKFLSKHYFDYDQEDYEAVTTITGEDGEPTQVGMSKLSATHTLGYGSDDTIMTSALWQHFRIIMELEGSIKAFFDVEEKAAYVTALAFANGTPISLERLRDMEREDDELEKKSKEVLNELLIKLGWDGTQTPKYTKEDLTTPAKIKEIYSNITGEELKTMVRTPSKLFALIRHQENGYASILATYLEAGNLDAINKLVEENYDGSPRFEANSPKQVRELLYTKLNLPIHLINNATDNERQNKPDLANACFKFNKILRGSDDVTLTAEDKELLKQKAKTDDTAIDFALAFDLKPDSLEYRGLKAFGDLKELTTRRNLFYNNYRHVKHWQTNMVHSSMRQCSTVTRRHSSGFPNIQQAPKPNKGKIRDMFISRYKGGLIVSADLSGAELRLGADLSRDENLMACFVGEHKKDMHSLTASSALRLRWGNEVVDTLMEHFQVETEYDLFIKLRRHQNEVDVPEDVNDLRGLGKNTNFASAYGGSAPKLAELLVISLEEADQMLKAKFSTYPRYETWKEEIEAEMAREGYVTTYLGARRHLQHAILSDNRWEISKAQRQGPNFMIQSSCGEALRLAMADLWDSGILWNLRCNFIAPVHDELVIDSHPDDAFEVAKVLHRCMVQEGYMEVVPFVSSLSIGTSFYDQPEIEFDDPEVFQAVKVLEAIEAAKQRHLQVA